MFDRILSVIAPHYCYGCGKTGQTICQKCKKHIIQMNYTTCVLCDRRPKYGNYCGRHHFPVRRIYCLLRRKGVVLRAIDALKFERKRAVINDLVNITDAFHSMSQMLSSIFSFRNFRPYFCLSAS